MSGKSVAGGGAIVVVSPLISQIEEQCSKIDSVIRSTMSLRRRHSHPPPYEYVNGDGHGIRWSGTSLIPRPPRPAFVLSLAK